MASGVTPLSTSGTASASCMPSATSVAGLAAGGLRAFASNLQVALGNLEPWFFFELLVPWNRR